MLIPNLSTHLTELSLFQHNCGHLKKEDTTMLVMLLAVQNKALHPFPFIAKTVYAYFKSVVQKH